MPTCDGSPECLHRQALLWPLSHQAQVQIDPCSGHRFCFFSSASKYKWIAAFQPHHHISLFRLFDKQSIDICLVVILPTSSPADINPFCRGRAYCSKHLIRKIIVQHDISLPQGTPSLSGSKVQDRLVPLRPSRPSPFFWISSCGPVDRLEYPIAASCEQPFRELSTDRLRLLNGSFIGIPKDLFAVHTGYQPFQLHPVLATLACAAIGTWQPPSSRWSNARSAKTLSYVGDGSIH